MMMPRTPVASTLPIAKRLRNSTPYSSSVWVLIVATRQWATNLGAEPFAAKPGMLISYTPSTVLVLPTSRTSSIGAPCQRAHAAGNHGPQTPVGAHAEKASWIQTVGNAAVPAVFIHVHRFAVRVRPT